MTDPKDEIAQAFAHPEARAIALGGDDPPDRISLRDHVAEAEIGAFQQERGLRQRLRFNVVVELRPHGGAATDDVDLILSYDKLTEAIAAELAAERLNLLETLAERIADRILTEPQPLRVFLRVEKLDRGPGALGVEIVRSRRDALRSAGAETPRPTVALLSPDAPDLAARIDRLIAGRCPLILVLTPPGLPRPAGTTDAARLRIDLLAVEQAAWSVAAHDRRLTVVATRTEIDWAMRQGHPILWAPSKLVLDSAGAPKAVGDGFAPARWLAEELNALRLIVHAPVAVPAECRVPVERG